MNHDETVKTAVNETLIKHRDLALHMTLWENIFTLPDG